MIIDRRDLIAAAASLALATKLHAKDAMMMKIEDVFLLLVTDKVAACQRFYERCFGFTTSFASRVYVQLASPEHAGRSFSLAFMPVDHPFGVIPKRAFSGDGLMLTIQTADVNALHARLVADGVPIIHGPKDEPWGQRRFDVRDPAGTFVDVVQPIEAEQGWFERFG